MNDLDSRFLKLGDCFAQKFSRPGTYRYIVTTAAGACLPVREDTYTIVVKPRNSKSDGGQHNVVVNTESGKLVAQPPEIVIEAGDVVLWHTLDAATPGFAVVGECEGKKFDSTALTAEALYSHAFGTPGRYVWVDAHRGKLRGEINVRAVDSCKPEDRKDWLEALRKGTLITVAGHRSEPEHVEILAGQTVFWAVEKAEGISITDTRLVRRKSPD